MQTSEHDYKGASAALDEAYDNFAFSECVTGEQFRTIKRALLIAERLMSEPSEWLKDPFSAYCFKGLRAKLIEEIDSDGK